MLKLRRIRLNHVSFFYSNKHDINSYVCVCMHDINMILMPYFNMFKKKKTGIFRAEFILQNTKNGCFHKLLKENGFF